MHFSYTFWERQFSSFLIFLKTSNKRTHTPLFTDQFVSLIEKDVAIDKLLN